MKILYKIFLLMTVSVGFASFGLQAQNTEQRIYSNNFSDKKLSAYPIPANNVVSFKLSASLKSEAKTVELVSVIGRSVAIQKVNPQDGEDIVFSNLNQLPEGVYIGVAKNADGKVLQTTKLIIQR